MVVFPAPDGAENIINFPFIAQVKTEKGFSFCLVTTRLTIVLSRAPNGLSFVQRYAEYWFRWLLNR